MDFYSEIALTDMRSSKFEIIKNSTSNPLEKRKIKYHLDKHFLFFFSYEKNEKNIINTFEDKNIFTLFYGIVLNDKDISGNTIPKLYKKYGVSFVNAINWEGVIIIHDKIKGRVMFSKSMNNTIEIYYKIKNGKIQVSSKIRPLISNQKIKMNKISIVNLLTYGHIPSPYTPFEDVKRIKPVSYMIVDYKNKKVTIKRYWNPKINTSKDISSVTLAKKLFEKMFLFTLKKRIESINTKNVSLFLSGGLDSTFILYELTKLLPKENIISYTLDLPNDKDYAEKIANFFDIKNIHIDVSMRKIIRNAARILCNTEMVTDGLDVYVHYFLAEKSKDEKIIFTGVEAEKIFSCGLDFRFLKYLDLFVTRKIIPSKSIDIYTLYLLLEHAHLFKKYNFVKVTKDRIVRNIKIPTSNSLSKKYSYLSIHAGYLSDVYPRFNQFITNPFYDRKILDLSFKISPMIKIHNGLDRFIIRSLLKNKIPDSTLERKKYYWNRDKKFVSEAYDVFAKYASAFISRPEIKLNTSVEKILKMPARAITIFNIELFLRIVELLNEGIKKPWKTIKP